MAVGEKIRTLREQRRLSEEQLAGLLHTSHATVSRMETGASKIDADRLPAIAQALGCHPCDFFDNGDGQDSQAARTAEFVRDWQQEEASRLSRLQRIRAELDVLIAEESA